MSVLDGIELWIAAVRWRREVERELRPLGLTLIQWMALDAAVALIREQRDAVSQVQIERRVEIDRATLSDVMTRLAKRGWIDRDIDVTGRAYRIYVTDAGAIAVEQGRAHIAKVSSDGTWAIRTTLGPRDAAAE